MERAALSIFSEASGRDNWTKTNNGRNSFTFSDWYGVETDSDGRVIELNLADNNLTGEISDSLRGLARLRRLELSKNKLSGAIPPELGNLTGLEVLDLSDNELSCDIPDLSPISRLAHLRLAKQLPVRRNTFRKSG